MINENAVKELTEMLIKQINDSKGESMTEEQKIPPVPSQDQEAITVTPEMLLAQIVNYIGEEFVIIPTNGWMNIVKTIQESSDEDLDKRLEALGIPVIPVSLAPKEQNEKSRIITPGNMPEGDGKIITL